MVAFSIKLIDISGSGGGSQFEKRAQKEKQYAFFPLRYMYIHMYFSETVNHISSLDGGPQSEKRAQPKQEGTPRSVPTI